MISCCAVHGYNAFVHSIYCIIPTIIEHILKQGWTFKTSWSDLDVFFFSRFFASNDLVNIACLAFDAYRA